MATNESQITRFPGGVGQFTFFGVGATAGELTVPGIRVGDRILLVESLTLSSGAPNAVADLTAEFSVTAANKVSNTGGTSTAGAFVAVTIARQKKA